MHNRVPQKGLVNTLHTNFSATHNLQVLWSLLMRRGRLLEPNFKLSSVFGPMIIVSVGLVSSDTTLGIPNVITNKLPIAQSLELSIVHERYSFHIQRGHSPHEITSPPPLAVGYETISITTFHLLFWYQRLFASPRATRHGCGVAVDSCLYNI